MAQSKCSERTAYLKEATIGGSVATETTYHYRTITIHVLVLYT